MYKVVDFSRIQRENVGVAVFFLDVCINQILSDADTSLNKTAFQLAAATSLQLALKTHGHKVIKHKDLVVLGRDMFSEHDIAEMEYRIITACKWFLHPTSTYCFFAQYLKLLHVPKSTKSSIYDFTLLIIELTVKDKQYTMHSCSIVAYASILVAMAFIEPNNISQDARRYFCQRISSMKRDNLNFPADNDSSRSLLEVIQKIQKSLETSSHLDRMGLLNMDALSMITAETNIDIFDIWPEIDSPSQSPRYVGSYCSAPHYLLN
jgi:hypothetical protein